MHIFNPDVFILFPPTPFPVPLLHRNNLETKKVVILADKSNHCETVLHPPKGICAPGKCLCVGGQIWPVTVA
jgi:hypothetical protein